MSRVDARNSRLPPVPGLEPVALPSSSVPGLETVALPPPSLQSSSTDVLSSAHENKFAAYVCDLTLIRN